MRTTWITLRVALHGMYRSFRSAAFRNALAFLSLFCFSSTAAENQGADQRLITAGGTLTEIVFALDAGDQIVAVDQSSQYPEAVRALPQVGYYRDLAAEGVLSFMPDRLLALEGAGREKVLTQISDIGVQVKIYEKPTSVEGLMQLISELGQDLNREQAATALQQEVRTSLPERAQLSDAKGLFLLSAGDRGLIAAGKNTVPQLLFEFNGIRNLADSHEGFKGINSESLAMLQPDFLVAPKHVVRGMGGKQAFCQIPALRLLQAAQRCRLLVMDSLMSLGMTPRLAEAIRIVKHWQQEAE